MNVLKVEELTKFYGNKKIIDNLSFNISNKESVVINGENGIGKSTTLKCIADIIPVNSGVIEINGVNYQEKKIKNYIGYSPDNSILFPYLSAIEHFKLWTSLRGLDSKYVSTAINMLKKLQFSESSMYETSNMYSNGMKQKVSFVGAIFHNPSLIILDEPFTAMDNESKNTAIKMIEKLKDNNSCILFTTHQNEIRNRLADKQITIRGVN